MSKLQFLDNLYKTKILPNIIIHESGCHLLKTHLTNNGYARTFISKIYEGVNTKMGSHRLTYQVVNKQILPSDTHVLHKCDVRNCVNPDHLFSGSNHDNILDKIAKGRMPSMKGSKNPNSILTEQQVLHIYSNKYLPRFKRKTIKYFQVLYNISKSTVVDILYNKSWKELTSFYSEQYLELKELRHG